MSAWHQSSFSTEPPIGWNDEQAHNEEKPTLLGQPELAAQGVVVDTNNGSFRCDLDAVMTSLQTPQPGSSSFSAPTPKSTPTRPAPSSTPSDLTNVFLESTQPSSMRNFLASAAFHTVRGVKVFGLIIDPGAAHALIGCDTLLEFMTKTGIKPVFMRTERSFVGIDGEPSPGCAKVSYPLGLKGLEATFEADIIGGPGSQCPGLLPLATMIRNRCGLLCGFFENDDGLFIITVREEWLGYRVYLTDSHHYILPCDDYDGVKAKPDRNLALLATHYMDQVSKHFGHMRDEDSKKGTNLHEVTPEYGRSNLSQKSSLNQYVQLWPGSKYAKDDIPTHLAEKDKKRLKIYYKALPERYYTSTQTQVVSPTNMMAFLESYGDQYPIWDVQEFFSGSAGLTHLASQVGLRVGFPVDFRDGWDLTSKDHQVMLEHCIECFRPGVLYFSPDFSHWNGGSKKAAVDDIAPLRERDETLHLWVLKVCENQNKRGGAYITAAPKNSLVHKRGTNYPKLRLLPNAKECATTSKCAWALKNAVGEFLEQRLYWIRISL